MAGKRWEGSRREGRGEGERGREGEGRNAFPHLFNPTLTTGDRFYPGCPCSLSALK